jgi:hypothetical protein
MHLRQLPALFAMRRDSDCNTDADTMHGEICTNTAANSLIINRQPD